MVLAQEEARTLNHNSQAGVQGDVPPVIGDFQRVVDTGRVLRVPREERRRTPAPTTAAARALTTVLGEPPGFAAASSRDLDVTAYGAARGCCVSPRMCRPAPALVRDHGRLPTMRASRRPAEDEADGEDDDEAYEDEDDEGALDDEEEPDEAEDEYAEEGEEDAADDQDKADRDKADRGRTGGDQPAPARSGRRR